MTDSIRFCVSCQCKTWHDNGVCEWTDMHQGEIIMVPRRRNDERRALTDEDLAPDDGKPLEERREWNLEQVRKRAERDDDVGANE